MCSLISRKQQGFTLVEIAIVLVIIGVLSTGALLGLGEFRSVQSVKEGGQKIDNIKKQLLIFGQVNKFLPCPDTDFDGFENRSGSACLNDVGTAPYVDLGLQREDVEDAWGNFIRYAVNRGADTGFVCDKRHSASYFCNSGFGVNWFTFTETPPLSTDRGDGNYFVCNESAASCNALSVTNRANLSYESASVVLVAYNQDGHQALTNCASMSGASRVNCESDEYYHQGVRTSDEANFYDDIVVGISGIEIKQAMLGKTVTWNEYPAIVGQGQLEPTYEDFDITVADNQAEIETAGDDVVLVKRNVDTALDLGSGDDYIAIGNDLDYGANLITGTGNDSVYIVGLANSGVSLGSGDDAFVLGTNLTQVLDAGTGNDKIWIQGDIESTATFTLGAGDDVVWLGESTDITSSNLLSTIDGGTDYDILVLENMTQSDWNTANGLSYITGFELVIFKDDGTGTREYITLP